jgi:hypothetical protein
MKIVREPYAALPALLDRRKQPAVDARSARCAAKRRKNGKSPAILCSSAASLFHFCITSKNLAAD